MKRSREVIAVIGSGMGGSLLATALRRQGREVVMLERGSHPRFAVGESTTPLANLIVEEIADEFAMPFLKPLAKWGSWQATHPELACGLKRGFTFYHHDLGRRFPRPAADALARQLMVGASPSDRLADTHWYRPEIDRFLVEQAVAAGVEYRDECRVESAEEGARSVRLSGRRRGRRFQLAADFVVDASGPRGCLHRLLSLPERRARGFPATSALYAHFADVAPLGAEFVPGEPPYPSEQAAVHHLFDGGWMWALRFNNGLTSAGVVATRPAARRLGLRPDAMGWDQVMSALPSVADSFRSARAATPFHWQPQVAYQAGRLCGRRWALLPSAAGVVDPLLSTGFPLNLLGVQRLARLLGEAEHQPIGLGLKEYAETTRREFERAALLVKALYRRLDRFDDFRELSLAYFAAAGFSEVLRRLGRAPRDADFLLGKHPSFGPRLRDLCLTSLGGVRFKRKVRRAIAPLDVLGLSDDSRSPWYPARTGDLFEHAAKLGVGRGDISAMLARCGFA